VSTGQYAFSVLAWHERALYPAAHGRPGPAAAAAARRSDSMSSSSDDGAPSFESAGGVSEEALAEGAARAISDGGEQPEGHSDSGDEFEEAEDDEAAAPDAPRARGRGRRRGGKWLVEGMRNLMSRKK